jgi:hypothetical protein
MMLTSSPTQSKPLLPTRWNAGLPKSAYRRPVEVVETEEGLLTVPLDEEDEAGVVEPALPGGTEHTEMQWHLAWIGHAMSYDVFIARDDRSRQWHGQDLGEMPGVISDLRLPFPDAAMRVIRHMDVIWLDRDMIRAAFEIERTTSIFSGLLRMTDLLSLQPNIAMPMFLVAPEDRREKVQVATSRSRQVGE